MRRPTLRRAIDFTIGAVGLVVAGPLIVTMIGIARFESGEPGLFRQTRYGLHGRPFVIYKIHNLDNRLNPLPLSGWFRKYGLDELPQLVNLVKGDMSIVGPRPHNKILDITGWERQFDILPGLTGLNIVQEKTAGIESTPEQRAKIEGEYVNRRLSGRSSLWTDMQIIFKSVKLMVAGRADAGKYSSPSCPPDLTIGRAERLHKLGYE